MRYKAVLVQILRYGVQYLYSDMANSSRIIAPSTAHTSSSFHLSLRLGLGLEIQATAENFQ